MIHYSPWENLFQQAGIDLILDVGANAGQTYDSFRWAGFQGPIWTSSRGRKCSRFWNNGRAMIGGGFRWLFRAGPARPAFNLTTSDNSNSLQIPLAGVKVTGQITVQTLRLDEFWSREKIAAKSVFLKIDTEGHDLEVVKGASGVLEKIKLIIVETAPIPRYQGEPALPAMVDYLDGLGVLRLPGGKKLIQRRRRHGHGAGCRFCPARAGRPVCNRKVSGEITALANSAFPMPLGHGHAAAHAECLGRHLQSRCGLPPFYSLRLIRRTMRRTVFSSWPDWMICARAIFIF